MEKLLLRMPSKEGIANDDQRIGIDGAYASYIELDHRTGGASAKKS